MAENLREQGDVGLLWANAAGVPSTGLVPLAGDVSARSYYRLDRGGGILAHYPPELRRAHDCFVRTTELLLRVGVRVPAILASDRQRQWMVTEDVGDRSLFRCEDVDLVAARFDRAFEFIRRIRGLPSAEVAGLSPALEGELLSREIRKTVAVFFTEVLAPDTVRRIEPVFYELCERLGGGPLEPAHRDFMSRNLMLLGERAELVVLDHQDLRLAPVGYDLASLCFDSSPLERARADAWLRSRLPEQMLESVWRCAAQRALKIVGTFVSFARTGRPAYLPMVPGALETAAAMLSRLPEGDADTVAVLQRCADQAADGSTEADAPPGSK